MNVLFVSINTISFDAGDTGPTYKEWVKLVLGKDMVFPHLRIIYPTAPLMSYTPSGGAMQNVWFNR